MNINKKIRAQYLLTEIGGIDDALLSEAIGYSARRRLRYRPLIAAAIIILTFITIIASTLISRTVMDTDENTHTNKDESISNIAQLSSLDEVFTIGIDQSAFNYVTDPSMLPYFDEHAHIVWKYAGDNKYYISSDIKQGVLERLQQEMGKGKNVGEGSPTLECTVWLLYGDGQVVSPYLISSPGNTASSVFDYRAEIYPERSLIERVFSILSS